MSEAIHEPYIYHMDEEEKSEVNRIISEKMGYDLKFWPHWISINPRDSRRPIDIFCNKSRYSEYYSRADDMTLVEQWLADKDTVMTTSRAMDDPPAFMPAHKYIASIIGNSGWFCGYGNTLLDAKSDAIRQIVPRL